MVKATKRVIIITGSVGNLGVATARAFQTAGDSTVLVDRSKDRLRGVFPEIADSPDHLLVGGVDLTDAALLERLVQDTLKRFGRIDALVNTVGGWRGGKPVHAGVGSASHLCALIFMWMHISPTMPLPYSINARQPRGCVH